MSRDSHSPSTPSSHTLTPEQIARVRTALRSAAGEALQLTGEELEERIAPGLNLGN